MQISLYCPKMPIRRVGLRHYRTAAEPMVATVTRDDGSEVVLAPVIIPETDVQVHLLSFPQIAQVDACVGEGSGVRVELPPEPVVVRLKGNIPELVAVAMTGCPIAVTMPDGKYSGTVDFPEAVTNLFSGGAEAVTATGTIAKVS